MQLLTKILQLLLIMLTVKGMKGEVVGGEEDGEGREGEKEEGEDGEGVGERKGEMKGEWNLLVS